MTVTSGSVIHITLPVVFSYFPTMNTFRQSLEPQSIDSDLDPTMMSAMRVSINLRTKYGEAPDAISSVLAGEFSKAAPNPLVGHSIFHSADVGDPLVVTWRPTYPDP